MRWFFVLIAAVLLVFAGQSVIAGRGGQRLASQDGERADVRRTPGVHPDDHPLSNGWGLTPAGKQVTLSDMPLKLAVSPDGRMLAASCGGFRNQGVALIDLQSHEVTQFVPLLRAWNG